MPIATCTDEIPEERVDGAWRGALDVVKELRVHDDENVRMLGEVLAGDVRTMKQKIDLLTIGKYGVWVPDRRTS